MILIVFKRFMRNLCQCNCWLINEVILRNARCNNEVYNHTELNSVMTSSKGPKKKLCRYKRGVALSEACGKSEGKV